MGWRSPALHFLAIGAVLFVARPWWERQATPRHAVAATTDDELLRREALDRGIDRADPAVRERLARLGRFVGEDARSEAELEAEARRLGLERSDVVVQRHLVQMMHLAAGKLGPADMPTEAELQAYLDAHAQAFAQPPRIRLTHVYLSRDRCGAALDAEAALLLRELRRSSVPPDVAAARGDAFLAGATIGPASPAELERIFGPELARSVAGAPPDHWIGPVPSPYGLHLVWVHEREPARVPSLGAVRSQVLHRLLRERSEERARTRVAALRARDARGDGE
ncbi:MAG TPA: peptidylprolyl isomerase [Candidatus Eisenbacteria bacterium]|nr:peptidylprolyl isomerase [Candidatus Eisenbacteria bacterium]